tara:strand:+ start:50 stop:190 length:141 start_codon:yes stop_codon:yes gene_type:complete
MDSKAFKLLYLSHLIKQANMPAISIDDIAFVEGDLSNQVKEKLGFM